MVPRTEENIWQFLERVVIVPNIVGSTDPGPLKTNRMPLWRGLLEKYADRRTRYFTLCKATRIGGTFLFGACLVIEKVLRWPGPIMWLGPTRKFVADTSRTDLQPYFSACLEIEEVRYKDKQRWTTLAMWFRACRLLLVGAGSVNDLAGKQGELAIIDEQDKIKNRKEDQPTPTQEMEARTSQFVHTRKIVRNSSPSVESGLTWTEFLNGSQHYPYVPCPHCGGYQRVTFGMDDEKTSESEKWMRIDDDDPLLIGHEIESSSRHGVPLAADTARSWYKKIERDELGWKVLGIPRGSELVWDENCKDPKTGRWDVDRAEATTRLKCCWCERLIRHEEMTRMGERYTLRGHNEFPPKGHISAQVSALYSSWTPWGQLTKEWLLSQGDAHKLKGFWNHKLGLPFQSRSTEVTPKTIADLKRNSPEYYRQYPDAETAELTLKFRPVFLTMHVDVQQTEFYWTVRALFEDGSRHLIAWGCCGTLKEIDRIAARVWTFDHGEACRPELRYEKFSCYMSVGKHYVRLCIMDSGYKAKSPVGVYAFVHDHSLHWVAVKGGAYRAQSGEKPIIEDTVPFDYPGKGRVEIDLVKTDDQMLQIQFSRFVMKERQGPPYCVPRDIDQDDVIVAHLTSPSLEGKRESDGRMTYEWKFACDPHLYDCEKYGEAMCQLLPPEALHRFRLIQDKLRADALAKLTAAK